MGEFYIYVLLKHREVRNDSQQARGGQEEQCSKELKRNVCNLQFTEARAHAVLGSLYILGKTFTPNLTFTVQLTLIDLTPETCGNMKCTQMWRTELP